ncbi:MAG: type I-E CRISPR-associated protein Cas7/Cse4/CasC [Lachnospiraceae bacterium]|nr:type I-E CRISPR-associated protein Cas7/Cse4/CasC [Lachnospiraceae bacterium]
MRHLDLHILQSHPVNCLNRDDLGSPKTAIFGGVQRARVSSQCWKRAIREQMAEEMPDRFAGMRTKLIKKPLWERLKAQGFSDEDAAKAAEAIASQLSKNSEEKAEKSAKAGSIEGKVKTLLFCSPNELDKVVEDYMDTRKAEKAVKTLAKKLPADAADIALFGRMVAADKSLTLEGAAMFAHAFSTHRVSNEVDFYTAVDDLDNKDEPGAGMLGTLEFNAATYYRFASVNLDLFASHMAVLTPEERADVIRAFIRATVMAVPHARQNSMLATTLPSYVFAVVRDSGHPISLATAFEKPVENKTGLMAESIQAIERKYDIVKRMYGLEALMEERVRTDVECDKTLTDLINKVVSYVR